MHLEQRLSELQCAAAVGGRVQLATEQREASRHLLVRCRRATSHPALLAALLAAREALSEQPVHLVRVRVRVRARVRVRGMVRVRVRDP